MPLDIEETLRDRKRKETGLGASPEPDAIEIPASVDPVAVELLSRTPYLVDPPEALQVAIPLANHLSAVGYALDTVVPTQIAVPNPYRLALHILKISGNGAVGISEYPSLSGGAICSTGAMTEPYILGYTGALWAYRAGGLSAIITVIELVRTEQ